MTPTSPDKPPVVTLRPAEPASTDAEPKTAVLATVEDTDTVVIDVAEASDRAAANREFSSGMNAFMSGAARFGSKLLRREPQGLWQIEAADRPALPDFGIAGGAAELRGDDITAWFGDHKVLDRVSLTMEAGKVTALIGPSGCGKSTFLRILNRMHEMVPTAALSGQVYLANEDIYAPDQRVTYARRNIGMVFQKANPFPAMSIYENTIAGLELCGIKATRSEKDYLVEDSLRKASLWEEVKDRLHQPGAGLSGGQQQRLCIARALAISPRVLLMDEPCSALDPTSTRRVEDTIAELRGQVTIVIVTHNMQQAARVSDQCAFFLAAQNTPGVIVEHGDTTAMFNNPQDERTSDYVGGRFG